MNHPNNKLRGIALLLSVISLLPLVPSAGAAGEPAKEPSPINVFKSLQAGKQQTVVVYGTSLTHSGGWVTSMKQYFDKQFPDQVTFVNAAKAGQTSDWGVKNLQQQVLDKKPDLVLIEFSINDAATKNNTSLEQTAANLDSIVKQLRTQNPQVDIVLQTMNPAWDQSQEKKSGSNRPQLAEYYDVYRRYAREHNLPLVDHYPNWLKLQQEEPAKFQKMVPDGLHPEKGGSRAVTWPAIEVLLEKARNAAAKAE